MLKSKKRRFINQWMILLGVSSIDFLVSLAKGATESFRRPGLAAYHC